MTYNVQAAARRLHDALATRPRYLLEVHVEYLQDAYDNGLAFADAAEKLLRDIRSSMSGIEGADNDERDRLTLIEKAIDALLAGLPS